MDNKIRNKIDSNKPLERVVKIQLSKKELRYFQKLSEEKKAQFIKNIEQNNSISNLKFFGWGFAWLLSAIQLASKCGVFYSPICAIFSTMCPFFLLKGKKTVKMQRHLLSDTAKTQVATAMALLSLVNSIGNVKFYKDRIKYDSDITFQSVLKDSTISAEDFIALASQLYRQIYGAYVVDKLFRADSAVPVKVSHEMTKEKETDENFSFDIFYQSAAANRFVDSKLSDVFLGPYLLGIYHFICDNPYIDKKLACEKIASIQIDVKPIDEKTAGFYRIATHNAKVEGNEIYMLAHEIEHSLGCLPNPILNEGMLSKIIEEYCFADTRTNGYQYTEIPFTSILCELLGADLMLQAYTERSMDLIDQKMIECGLSQNEVQRLYQIMDQTSAIEKNNSANAQVQLDLLKQDFQTLITKVINSPIVMSKLESTRLDLVSLYMSTAFCAEERMPPSRPYFNVYSEMNLYNQDNNELESEFMEQKRSR